MERVEVVAVKAFWGRTKADAREAVHTNATVEREKRTII
jgi:hypothetical protein